MRMASVPVSLLVCDAGASTSEDYVGLTDLDVRTALTQLMESNYREWKKLDEMDGATAAMETLKMQRSIDSSGV